MRISDWSSDVCSSDLSSHALFLIDVRKPEMVSGLRAEGVFIMTNIVILTGRIARDPETRETKSGTSVTGITVVTDLANRIVRTVPGPMLEFCHAIGQGPFSVLAFLRFRISEDRRLGNG